MLLADALAQDPEFLAAKQALIEKTLSYSQKIDKIAPPKSSFVQSYEKTLQEFEEIRGFPLFFPYLGSGMGNGALVELADGSVKYDLISGIGVHFGHCHPAILSAGIDAAVQDIAMEGNLMQNRDAYSLAKLLCSSSGMDHCFLSSSGAIANENGLKLAFQKKASAHRLLAFENCFMGRTITLSQITDRPQFREGLPANLFVDYLPFYDWKDPMGSTERAITTLKRHLERYPGEYVCICMEMIQGEGGGYPGKTEFFMALIDILKKAGIAIFVDEIQTFGRTDCLFAFQHFGLQDVVDIVTVGKLLHTCATLYSDAYRPKPGLLSQTYTAATSSIRASLAIVQSLQEEGYLGLHGKNLQVRRLFVQRLQEIAERHPKLLSGPFGHGLIIAATPFGGEREKVVQFTKALFDAGIISFVSGVNPVRIRFLVPVGGITEEGIVEVTKIMEEVLLELR
ncbi:MAG: Acetylornithine/acetyl-lysine aminotransferase [Chlamydiae bacterium]|nr:Acetylornithine/acetyl-lysine aminotransferase [Chlamydiota bacterium]